MAKKPGPEKLSRGRPRKFNPAAENAAIGQRIREARERAGLSVEAAAANSGVSSPAWYRWERGDDAGWIATMAAICDTLGVEVCDLVPEAE